MDNALIIYHDLCYDGFGSSFSAWYHLVKLNHENVEFHAARHGQEPPNVKDKNVYILDFSYKRPILEYLASQAKSLIVLDHHKTAAADLQNLSYCTFNMNKSGAQLAWEHFDFLPAPKLINYIADKDLWNWKLPHSKEINLAIESYPRDFETWLWLKDSLENDFDSILQGGQAILRYQEQLINDIISKNAVEVEFEGYKILAANTYILRSEVANRLATDRPFGMAWSRSANGMYSYSLRGVVDKPYSIDTSQIAIKYNGGGHRFASAFESPILLI